MYQSEYELRHRTTEPSGSASSYVLRSSHLFIALIVATLLILVLLSVTSQNPELSALGVLLVAVTAMLLSAAVTRRVRLLLSSLAVLAMVYTVWMVVHLSSDGRPESSLLWGALTVSYALFALWLTPGLRRSPYVIWPLTVLTLASLQMYQGSMSGTYAGWAVIGLWAVLAIVWCGTLGARPRPYVTWTLLLIVLTAWGVAEVSARVTETVGETLLRLGAQEGGRVASGEYWRLFTSVFLHFGFVHLAGNCIRIVIYGHLVERLYGRARLLFIFSISGLAGSVTSYVYATDGWAFASAGASGATYGLASATAVFVVLGPCKFWEMGTLSRAITIVLAVMSVMGLAFDLWAVFVSNDPPPNAFAHIGGFAAGLLLTVALLPRNRQTKGLSYQGDGHLEHAGSILRRWWALPVSVMILAGGVFIGNDRTPTAYAERAEEHLARRDLNLARDEVQRALDKDHVHGLANLVNARILIEKKDLDAALGSAGTAVWSLSGPRQTEAADLLAELRCKTDPWLAGTESCAQYLE